MCFCVIEPYQENRLSLYITGYAQNPISSIEDAVAPLEHILPTIIEKTHEAKDNISDRQKIRAKNKLTRDEEAAIYLYTMEWEDSRLSLYSLLNTRLRSAHDLEEMEPWFAFLKLFLIALLKIPSIEQTIWRGVKMDLSNDYSKDQEIIWWSISSCTESIDILESDQFLGQDGPRTLFSIECCRAKSINEYSAFPGENELLLLPGTKLQVVSKVTLGPEFHIIQLKEIIPTTPYLEIPMTKQELQHERRKNHRKPNVPKFEMVQTDTVWPKILIACAIICVVCAVSLAIALSITLRQKADTTSTTALITTRNSTLTTSMTTSSTTTLPSNTSTCQLVTLPSNAYQTGTNPIAMAAGDFDNDGLLDISVANYGSADLTVLYGYGSGTFRPRRTFQFESKPDWIVSSDFNNDHQTDIVVTHSINHSIGILIGNHDGTFANERTFRIGSSLTSITVGDFNNDGQLDLAGISYANSSLSVLLGLGNGSFTTPIISFIGLQPKSLATGDFNNDAQPDIAVCNHGDNTIGILLGYGNGSFSQQMIYPTGMGPSSIAVGDLNNDTYLDIACANNASSNIALLFGNGNGSFTIQPPLSLENGSFPSAIAIDDMNLDLIADIAVASQGSNNVRVFFSYGNATFAPPLTYSTHFGFYPIALGISNSKLYHPQGIAVTKYASNTVEIILILC